MSAFSLLRAARSARVGSPTAKAMLFALVSHADEGGMSWASASTLAQEVEVSERQGRRVLRQLEEMGAVTATRLPGRPVRRTVSLKGLAALATPDTHVTPDAGVTPDTHDRGPLTPMTGGDDTHDRGPLTPVSAEVPREDPNEVPREEKDVRARLPPSWPQLAEAWARWRTASGQRPHPGLDPTKGEGRVVAQAAKTRGVANVLAVLAYFATADDDRAGGANFHRGETSAPETLLGRNKTFPRYLRWAKNPDEWRPSKGNKRAEWVAVGGSSEPEGWHPEARFTDDDNDLVSAAGLVEDGRGRLCECHGEGCRACYDDSMIRGWVSG